MEDYSYVKLKFDVIFQWLVGNNVPNKFLNVRKKQLLDTRVEELKLKPRKSIAVCDKDIDMINTYFCSFDDKILFTRETSLDYQVIEQVILRKTCSENTLQLLKEKLELETR